MNTQPHQRKSLGLVHAKISVIFVSLELSKSTWLVTSISPGAGEKMSRHVVAGGNVAALMERLDTLWHKRCKERAATFP